MTGPTVLNTPPLHSGGRNTSQGHRRVGVPSLLDGVSDDSRPRGWTGRPLSGLPVGRPPPPLPVALIARPRAAAGRPCAPRLLRDPRRPRRNSSFGRALSALPSRRPTCPPTPYWIDPRSNSTPVASSLRRGGSVGSRILSQETSSGSRR